MTSRLVPARPADLRTLTDWIPDARACELWSGGKVTYPIDVLRMAEEIRLPGSVERVLEVDARVVGFGQLSFWPAGRGHLSRLIVDPRARGRGFGRRLVELLLEEATGCGGRRASLNVDRTNLGAIALYRAIGFEEAVRPEGGGAANWLYMERPLIPAPYIS